jgi:hypothetical protein
MSSDKVTLARVAVLEQFVRFAFCASFPPGTITPAQISEMSEGIKADVESSMAPESAAYVTAAVDSFFNALASDLRRREANR